MSYGYYRLGSSADPDRAYDLYKERLRHDHFAAGLEAKTEEWKKAQLAKGVVAGTDEAQKVGEPTAVAATLLGDHRAAGYTGDTCATCFGSRMRWAGHCQVCEDCGSSSGCS